MMQEALAAALKALIEEAGLRPWRLYTAREAAQVLGLSDKAVYAIPECVLPRTRVGEAQSGVRFAGLHLMCYLLGQDPPAPELIDHILRGTIKRRGRVVGLRRGGKTRVL